MRLWICALALVLVSVSPSAQTPTSQPLVQPADVTLDGCFRLPTGWTGEFGSFSYGGAGAAFNPSGPGLFIIGHPYGNWVAEVSLPTPGDCANLAGLPFASFRQPFSDPTDGQGAKILIDANGQPINSSIRANGLLVVGDKLLVDRFAWYDAANQQVTSHFVRSKTLSQTGSVIGPTRIDGAHGDKAGFTSGPMAAIPLEWQALFGGDALAEQWGIPIVTRASYGPAAFVFTSADIGVKTPVPSVPVLYYEDVDGHRTLGAWNSSGQLWNSNANNGGFAFVPGTRSLLYVINRGMGPFCYDNQNGCPPGAQSVTSSQPYQPSIYFYDANDLLAVKNGTKHPWEPVPYATLPIGPLNPYFTAGPLASALDPVNKRLYIVTAGDGDQPYVQVWTIGAGSAPPVVDPPPIVTPPPSVDPCVSVPLKFSVRGWPSSGAGNKRFDYSTNAQVRVDLNVLTPKWTATATDARGCVVTVTK